MSPLVTLRTRCVIYYFKSDAIDESDPPRVDFLPVAESDGRAGRARRNDRHPATLGPPRRRNPRILRGLPLPVAPRRCPLHRGNRTDRPRTRPRRSATGDGHQPAARMQPAASAPTRGTVHRPSTPPALWSGSARRVCRQRAQTRARRPPAVRVRVGARVRGSRLTTGDGSLSGTKARASSRPSQPPLQPATKSAVVPGPTHARSLRPPHSGHGPRQAFP